ncbi:SDR family NAD(P)-dependent oxidoreductase [Microbacterium foliorum]|uniref:SDR family NAD(P)-dependent oxidoreductase n=1 Tax=Microbacterium foliorum TaxID=104336 RepID=UPI0021597207|nr:SDR family NAD(P)-dependent oxidoreductase [Microbacterium foliorum]
MTGGNRGLGRALTLAALDVGHAVVATVRGDHTLPDHERLTVMNLDVRDRAAAHEVVEHAAGVRGSIDVLVNNAGYGVIGAVEEASEEDARAIVDTNLLGPLWLSQAVIPIMRSQGSGHIVQISTVGAVGTMPMLGLYNSTKWGLEAFSEAMAGEVGRFGVRVSLIEPGALDTEWAGSSMRFSSPLAPYDGNESRCSALPRCPGLRLSREAARHRRVLPRRSSPESGRRTIPASACSSVTTRPPRSQRLSRCARRTTPSIHASRPLDALPCRAPSTRALVV